MEELKITFDRLELKHQKSSDVANQIMQTVDYVNNGNLNFSEFLSGTLDPSIHFSDFHLK